LTFGSLWPPQIREYVFTSKVLKHSSKADEDDELRKRQTRILQEEVQTLRDDLLQDLAMDRTQVVQMKSLVAERKQLIQSEMKHIKQLVTMLFEQQAGM
jgi:poly-D-alanine transfer protein DltD